MITISAKTGVMATATGETVGFHLCNFSHGIVYPHGIFCSTYTRAYLFNRLLSSTVPREPQGISECKSDIQCFSFFFKATAASRERGLLLCHWRSARRHKTRNPTSANVFKSQGTDSETGYNENPHRTGPVRTREKEIITAPITVEPVPSNVRLDHVYSMPIPYDVT